VTHERFIPKGHRFVYRLFMLAIDLDELHQIDQRSRLLSVNRPNVYSFRESDYLPTNESLHNASISVETGRTPDREEPDSLKARISTLLTASDIARRLERVELITMPRIFGYQFNPVSFYFCYDSDDAPMAAIAEVTNTFREVKHYVLKPETLSRSAFRLQVPKHFYVSPYSDVDLIFDFVLRPAGERLCIRIDDYAGDDRTLTSVLTGAAVPLSDGNLGWFLVKYPFLTLKVIALIHWQALILYLKKVPWYRKAARSEEQRDLYRPHVSLATANSLKK
jgi:DUF1365 family protein